MIDSAKSLGWIAKHLFDEENFRDGILFSSNSIKEFPFFHLDQKDLGCLVKLSIDRIEIPAQLLSQSDKNRTNIFAQYRFYDKSISRKINLK
jgi:hypothetical protein